MTRSPVLFTPLGTYVLNPTTPEPVCTLLAAQARVARAPGRVRPRLAGLAVGLFVAVLVTALQVGGWVPFAGMSAGPLYVALGLFVVVTTQVALPVSRHLAVRDLEITMAGEQANLNGVQYQVVSTSEFVAASEWNGEAHQLLWRCAVQRSALNVLTRQTDACDRRRRDVSREMDTLTRSVERAQSQLLTLCDLPSEAELNEANIRRILVEAQAAARR